MIPTVHMISEAISDLGFYAEVVEDMARPGTLWVSIIDGDRDDRIAEDWDAEYPHARAYLSGLLTFCDDDGEGEVRSVYWDGKLHTGDDKEHTREFAAWIQERMGEAGSTT